MSKCFADNIPSITDCEVDADIWIHTSYTFNRYKEKEVDF